MDKNEDGFSLIIVVIFMSIAALFVGYVMGSWLISFLVEDDAEIAEEQMNNTNVNQQIATETPKEPEEVNNQENNLTAPTSEKDNIVSQPAGTNNSAAVDSTNAESNQNNQSTDQTTSTSKTKEIEGNFAVQIGAFSNYNNALAVKNKVEELGYQILITNSSPHQVQVVGYSSRDAAESVLEELKSNGYNGFIVVRE
ncbi:Sporulation related domain-containing protein [Halanaerobium congolense]|jgi:cell division protein FtsN|uniref:Sporulation related domain-containing protein n=1 Tax=Halanaerobium congolense TaxID=54121 RepID=A0A1G8NBR6_9FIRM|nr:SPOR domain-containing protein [Halanaerobium congolense]KXS48168.1 MAG: sporulation domain-containing protein [Halanaerobium sp. T82-1]PXV67569.1 sporulation related protein [Halanaerobium congolense]TDP06712.1 sporulation related protein [Halanaerobium congolense]TDS32878.1 sporulation related protein [Halanaerobium congolense]SDH41871.1 Sporulation related domain-containing protein [Halanaerobium congolense]